MERIARVQTNSVTFRCRSCNPNDVRRRKSREMLKERASGAVTKPIPLTSILGHDTGGVCQIADDPGGAVRILDKSPVLGALGSARQVERNGAGCDPDRSQA